MKRLRPDQFRVRSERYNTLIGAHEYAAPRRT